MATGYLSSHLSQDENRSITPYSTSVAFTDYGPCSVVEASKKLLNRGLVGSGTFSRKGKELRSIADPKTEARRRVDGTLHTCKEEVTTR